jgi:hypothetical protein
MDRKQEGNAKMKILFLDESGDHNLSIIDSQYPLFVLGGIIVDKEYAENQLTESVNKFKKDMFGTHDIILHTADISRNRNGFEEMKKVVFRERFYERINNLMRSLEYMVIACVVQKKELLSRYGLAALDPYLLSLDILVERFCFEIGDKQGGGVIIAERRCPTLDRELELAWLNLKIQGTRYIKAHEVECRITDLTLRAKTDNIAGLQLADLVVTPLGRYVMGKPRKEDFAVIESKLRCNHLGQYNGYGLVVLPK